MKIVKPIKNETCSTNDTSLNNLESRFDDGWQPVVWTFKNDGQWLALCTLWLVAFCVVFGAGLWYLSGLSR